MNINNNIDYKRNCLSLIRYIAAINVLWFHMVTHLLLQMPSWINSIFGYFRGVPLFFAISGFTIYLSLSKDCSYKTYFKKRFFRIYPELWLSILVSIISIFLLYSNVRNINGVFVLTGFSATQGTILQFYTPDLLRGYGVGTPNGSLWTICTLIQFYFLAIFIYRFFNKKKIYWWITLFLTSIGMGVVYLFLQNNIPELLFKLLDQLVFRYLWIFVLGMITAKYKDKIIPFIKKIWPLLLIVSVFFYLTKIDIDIPYPFFHSSFMIIGLIGFSYAIPKLSLNKDFTYGIYLYHMIVINVFVQLSIVKKYWLIPIVFLSTFVLAYISYLFSILIKKCFEKSRSKYLDKKI